MKRQNQPKQSGLLYYAVRTFIILVIFELAYVFLKEPSTHTVPVDEKPTTRSVEIDSVRKNPTTTAATTATTTTIPVSESSSNPNSQVKPHRHGSIDSIESFKSGISWKEFVSLSQGYQPKSDRINSPDIQFVPDTHCDVNMENELSHPILSPSNLSWCKWALNPTADGGAGVQVGKSWGQLTNPQKEEFEELNCNAFARGVNPSCNDEWGDAHILNWTKVPVTSVRCTPSATSSVKCYDNENLDRFCVMKNVRFDFSKMRFNPRPGQETPSRDFDNDFMSIDCGDGVSNSFLKWNYLFSTQVSIPQHHH